MKAAMYLRISKEDGNVKESESIENQRRLIFDFCKDNGLEISGEYVDDGYSGTSAENRPALSRLCEDIRKGYIKLVITKDLSRLGRNIGDTANFIDRFFPEHGVRFISVTEKIDTAVCDSSLNFITPVHNFANELYSADISNKIRAALQNKINNGDYIGSFAPYGYKKSPTNKNILIPDDITAPTVKRIFHLASEGMKPSLIAETLNTSGVPSPLFQRSINNPRCSGMTTKKEWTGNGIGKLLRNPVYLGHTVQGKTRKPSFKSTKTKALPKEQWKTIRFTHPPLTDDETFAKVRKFMLARRGRKTTGFTNLFSGIAFCRDCKKAMSLSGKSKEGYKLNCGGYKRLGNSVCSSRPVSYSLIYNEITRVLSDVYLYAEKNYSDLCMEVLKELSDTDKTHRELDLLKEKKLRLYDGKYSGEISDEDFNLLLKKYNKEEEYLSDKLKKASPQPPPLREIIPEKPDKKALARFIDRIEIGSNREADIYLTFCFPSKI